MCIVFLLVVSLVSADFCEDANALKKQLLNQIITEQGGADTKDIAKIRPALQIAQTSDNCGGDFKTEIDALNRLLIQTGAAGEGEGMNYGLLAGGGGGLIVLVLALWKKKEYVKDKAKGAWGGIKAAPGKIWSGIKGAPGKIKGAYDDFNAEKETEKMKDLAGVVHGTIKNIANLFDAKALLLGLTLVKENEKKEEEDTERITAAMKFIPHKAREALKSGLDLQRERETFIKINKILGKLKPFSKWTFVPGTLNNLDYVLSDTQWKTGWDFKRFIEAGDNAWKKELNNEGMTEEDINLIINLKDKRAETAAVSKKRIFAAIFFLNKQIIEEFNKLHVALNKEYKEMIEKLKWMAAVRVKVIKLKEILHGKTNEGRLIESELRQLFGSAEGNGLDEVMQRLNILEKHIIATGQKYGHEYKNINDSRVKGFYPYLKSMKEQETYFFNQIKVQNDEIRYVLKIIQDLETKWDEDDFRKINGIYESMGERYSNEIETHDKWVEESQNADKVFVQIMLDVIIGGVMMSPTIDNFSNALLVFSELARAKREASGREVNDEGCFEDMKKGCEKIMKRMSKILQTREDLFKSAGQNLWDSTEWRDVEKAIDKSKKQQHELDNAEKEFKKACAELITDSRKCKDKYSTGTTAAAPGALPSAGRTAPARNGEEIMTLMQNAINGFDEINNELNEKANKELNELLKFENFPTTANEAYDFIIKEGGLNDLNEKLIRKNKLLLEPIEEFYGGVDPDRIKSMHQQLDEAVKKNLAYSKEEYTKSYNDHRKNPNNKLLKDSWLFILSGKSFIWNLINIYTLKKDILEKKIERQQQTRNRLDTVM